jgi:hypothetical protein
VRPLLPLALLAACAAPTPAGTSGEPHAASSAEPSSTSEGAATTTRGSSTGAPDGTTGAATSAGETADDATTGEADAPAQPLRFAVIGDYGVDGEAEAAVAARVIAWDPAIVLTVGDNNYYDGEAATIDANIGKHYRRFIHPYRGAYGRGAKRNRFFPAPGNHDWRADGLQPYLDYFELPGNERYYRALRGSVEFFVVDSDPHEPDGISADSAQAQWLAAALAESTAAFQVVLMHHPPYSSGWHLGSKTLRWPYAAWGADLVIAGHDHDYERLVVDGLPYLVAGTGGAGLRPFSLEEVGAQRGHADAHGALLASADDERLTLEFWSQGGALVDRVTLLADPPAAWSTRVKRGARWRWHEGAAPFGWQVPGFDADAWASGPAPLGFGVGDEATPLPGGAPGARPMTTCFRHTFTARPEDVGAPLRLRAAVDDGAVFYLNGVEVYRLNLRDAAVGPATAAASEVRDWYAPKLAETAVPGDALVAGDNVLAVEVHQFAADSDDLRLEVELAVGAE